MLHVDLPTRAEIERLAAFRGGPAVSLYLPTTPLTQDAQADRIQLKNLLKAAVVEIEGTPFTGESATSRCSTRGSSG